MSPVGSPGRAAAAGLIALGAPVAVAKTATITVYAAGSLRAALTEIATAFEAAPGGGPVRLVFGASGLLKDRLQTGEPADGAHRGSSA